MHKYKFYFKDGSIKYSFNKEKIFSFNEIIDWDKYDEISKKNMDLHQILKYTYKTYKNIYDKEYYKIEIIDDNNEVIDSYEENK